MDRIDVMRLFVRIVERSSFSAAAKDLRVPRASVTRAVQQLEAGLGVRLLERTTRAVRPTEDGSLYYGKCLHLLAELDELGQVFRKEAPAGTVSVDLQATLARFFVLPAVPDFLSRYPAIALSLTETDRMVDLVTEGIDCVLRAGPLPDSSLVGRQVATARQITLASPGYLDRFGLPMSINDLSDHRMVAYIASVTGQPYPLDFTVDGQEREIALAFDVAVRGAEIYTAAGLAGLGLIQVPRYRVEHQIRAGELVPVLEHQPPAPMPVHVLYPANRHLAPRVRAFGDWLTQLFEIAQVNGTI